MYSPLAAWKLTQSLIFVIAMNTLVCEYNPATDEQMQCPLQHATNSLCEQV